MVRELTEDQERVRGYLRTLSERSSWLDLWPRVTEGRLQLIEALRGVTDEQARFKPSEDEWSILEVADHITSNSRSVISLVQALAIGEPPPSREALQDERPTEVTDQPIANLRTQLIETGMQLSGLVGRLPEPPSMTGEHPHVFFGDLHCKAWYLFQRIHDTDHANQIEAAKQAPGRLTARGTSRGANMHEEAVVQRMTERGLRLGTAESTIGGLIGHLLTNVPGSSKVFVGGIAAYHRSAKTGVMGVDADALQAAGSVSEDAVRRMAHATRDRLGVDVVVSESGVADRRPQGSTKEGPGGIYYIGIVAPDGYDKVGRYEYDGDRQSTKQQAADEALGLVLEYLDGSA